MKGKKRRVEKECEREERECGSISVLLLVNKDVFANICKFLDAVSLARLNMTCSSLRDLIPKQRWETLRRLHFGLCNSTATFGELTSLFPWDWNSILHDPVWWAGLLYSMWGMEMLFEKEFCDDPSSKVKTQVFFCSFFLLPMRSQGTCKASFH